MRPRPELSAYKMVPDDSPIFAGAPPGVSRLMDTVLYVRHSDWASLLECAARKIGGQNAVDRLRLGIFKFPGWEFHGTSLLLEDQGYATAPEKRNPG